MKERGEMLLRKALDSPDATFRDGQWESIKELIDGNRVLVVQRTGWGKSMVYFLATKLLREQGSGPALLVSPLLSLMRNQVEAAQRMDVVARTINSDNTNEWTSIGDELRADQVDVLIISPERLANQDFRQKVLAEIAGNIGLFVVDEAHCISDWGHDFRPDYKRIVRVLQLLPSNVPVLATTATANNRVVADIESQLGGNLLIQRGALVRKSLKLQNIELPSPSARMAWLAQTIPSLSGSGIVYTLTTRDAERVAEWLRANDIEAEAYYAGVGNAEDGTSVKEDLEQRLLSNEIKVLVATVALGMGFDKPDLRFVIHFQRPASVVHYYQQVGRAGRGISEAYGVLLCGEEDDHIADYFIRSAFPPQQHISGILEALKASQEGLSVPEMQRVLNMKKGQIEKALKYMTVESPSPIVKIDTKWHSTPAAESYQVDQEFIRSITSIRKAEQQQMQNYMEHEGCLMAFLQNALDDPSSMVCKKCKNCNPNAMLDESCDDELINRASLFLRRSYLPLNVRKQWPSKDMFEHYDFEGARIPSDLQAEEGRALSLWRDAGWGNLVAEGKYTDETFPDELVAACVELMKHWGPEPAPEWVTCIPSLSRPNLVKNFAVRLAGALEIPFAPCIEKVCNNAQQKKMENSYKQAKNLDGVFSIKRECLHDGPCLLVDDIVDSGWTFTVAVALLRQAGCSAVFPLALALNSPRMD